MSSLPCLAISLCVCWPGQTTEVARACQVLRQMECKHSKSQEVALSHLSAASRVHPESPANLAGPPVGRAPPERAFWLPWGLGTSRLPV